MSKILEVRNLQFNYQNKKLFDGLNLSFDEAKFTTIIGNNKSGKSTLIKLLCGLLDSKNSIIVEYAYINSNKINDYSRFFGVVFSANDNHFLFNNVYKELSFPLENLNIAPQEIEKRVIEIAREFSVTKLLDSKIEDLTKSEKQELLLILALIHEPKVLLLDNPFSMMTKKTKNKCLKIINKRIKNDNLTVVLATTNLSDIIDSDYTYVLNSGNLVMEGKPLSILREEKFLTRLGLELPFMIDLSLKLQFYELLDKEYTDMDRMVDTLWK